MVTEEPMGKREQPLTPPPDPNLSPTLHEWRPSQKERRHRIQAPIIIVGFFVVLVHANRPPLLGALLFDLLFVGLGLILASVKSPHLLAGENWFSADGKSYVRLDRLTEVTGSSGRSGTSIDLQDDEGRRVHVTGENLGRSRTIEDVVYGAIRRAVTSRKIDPGPLSRHNLGLNSRSQQIADAREELDAEIGDTGEPPHRNGGRRHRRR